MKAQLTRVVRFCLDGDGALRTGEPVSNAFAAWPTMRGLGRYYELHVTCIGQVDAATGYLINITHIDRAVREKVLPVVARAALENLPVGRLLGEALRQLYDALDVPVLKIRLQLMPTHGIEMESSNMKAALIDQRFDFSAAHRLHVPGMSDAKNRSAFGKCNNPSGHGHNYRLRVTVRCPLDEAGHVLSLAKLDELVNRVVIERFDHKHLNIDTQEFAAINPSVENIARVIYDLLAEPVKSIGVALARVTVWETDKTSATYPAPAPEIE